MTDLELLSILKTRFETNMNWHKGILWVKVQEKLEAHPEKRFALKEMERTGGEPDVIGLDDITGEYLFQDCSPESPIGRRSICYDPEALASRKEHKPLNSVIGMAADMGILCCQGFSRLAKDLVKTPTRIEKEKG